MKPAYDTGIDTLRAVVRYFDAQNEAFCQGFTPEQLVQLYRMSLASGWDFYPDQWTSRQISEALAGVVPRWDANERPVY